MNFFTQQGWQCPLCQRIYSPTTPTCFTCPQKVVTTSTSPKREPLTDEEIEQLENDTCTLGFPETVRAIEAKLKEKNT